MKSGLKRVFIPGLKISSKDFMAAFVRWLKETTDETAKLGIVIDRAFMCYGHHFNFGGNVCGSDRQGVFAR
ncbi:MAG TPA: hypothetical protein VGO57_15120 [Verrucomicrobiae bacterium]